MHICKTNTIWLDDKPLHVSLLVTNNLTLDFVCLNGLIMIPTIGELKYLLQAKFVYLHGRLYEWYIKSASKERNKFLFLSFMKCIWNFHILLSMPLMIKGRKFPPSTSQFITPVETLPHTYLHKWGLSLFMFYRSSTRAQKRATDMQFFPLHISLTFRIPVAIKHQFLFPVPFLWF